MVSGPFRAILLLSFSSPRRGTPFILQVQGACAEAPRHRGGLRRKPGCGFDDLKHVLEFSNFDICVV